MKLHSPVSRGEEISEEEDVLSLMPSSVIVGRAEEWLMFCACGADVEGSMAALRAPDWTVTTSGGGFFRLNASEPSDKDLRVRSHKASSAHVEPKEESAPTSGS